MVAPEGWEIVELDEVAIIGDGLHGTPEYDKNGRYFFINGNNLQNGRIVVDINTKRVNFNVYEKLDNHFSLDTIFMSINGTIGNMAYFNNEMVVIGKSIAYFNSSKRISKNYLFFYLQNNQLLEYFCEALTGSTIKNLGLNVIRKAKLLLPPLPEQLRIAEVLSDTDLYITTLERLIAKKEAVKQGVMQELLTGKRRLSGFKGEWVEKRLGEIAEVIMGQSPQSHSYNYNINGLPLIQGNTNIKDRKTVAEIYTTHITKIAHIGDIILTVRAPVGVTGRVMFKCCIGRGVCAIKGNDFLYHTLIFIEPCWAKLSKGSTFDSVTGQDINNIFIKIPPTLAEQTAIAEILSDMDAELSALKKKLEKIRLIKQGMMDALLMGKIRLPEDKPNVQFTQRKEPEEILYAAEKTEEYTANHKKRNKHIDDAVMIAGIVNELYSQKYPLGRKKVQKCLYLLRRHQKRSTTEFKKKAAGPYADEIRYRGGEPIALSAQYIITQKGTKGTLFFKGTNIQQALNYIEQWNMQTDIQWLRERLKFKSVDTLELWATVDMAICDLENMQMPISLSSIKYLIATNEEWKKKLEKPLFNDANIIKAISELRTLFEYKSK
ncbi:restriction endonuclease subunit S [Treponema socranskii]|uniref:restriction endonuclease subunit S n=1 Tax=Treponema socranskii TaxID=53419 RepID=UPI002871636E|nr:restriction endonuclease subunit S [Treponema socranskii]MDR9859500.1 restriction endonuclease subunit S [Treponema socranskii]